MKSQFFAVLGAIFAILFGPAALAGDSVLSEIRVGLLAHDVALFSKSKEDGFDVSGEVLFHSPEFLNWALSPRPHLGVSYAPHDGSTSQYYFGLTWEQDLAGGLFGYLSVGGAVHDADQLGEFDPVTNEINQGKALGCRFLFRESFGLGYRVTQRINFIAHLEHISNADLCTNNEGLTNVGFRVGWKF